MGFWFFLAVIIAAAYYADVQGKKQRAELVRIAMEKGQSLDPALIERLFPLEDGNQWRAPTDARRVRVGAVITASAGIGLVLLAVAVRQFSERGFWIWLGLAGLTLTVACGVFVASMMLGRGDLPVQDGDLQP
jgi:hypothetical protein